MKFFDNYFFFTIFIHYKLKLCRKISALMNKGHICQVVSKPTPRPTKLKKFSGHSSVKKIIFRADKTSCYSKRVLGTTNDEKSREDFS